MPKPPKLVIDGKKLCGRCDQMRQVSAFGVDKGTASGLKNWCKECWSAYHVEYKARGVVYDVHILSESEQAKVVALYDNGAKIADLARQFGVSKSVIDKVVKLFGVKRFRVKKEPRQPKRKYSRHNQVLIDQDGLKLCTKCEKKHPVSEFRKNNRMASGLRGWCKGCEAHHSKTVINVQSVPPDRHQEAVVMYSNGMTYEEIGKHFEVSEGTIGKLFKMLGVKPRRSRLRAPAGTQIEEGNAWCTRCCEQRPIAYFAPDRRYANGLSAYCRDCKSDSGRERNYGLQRDDLARMRQQQNDQCKICAKPFTENRRSFVVDHCHTTGAVRGLLCYTCNSGIGFFRDDPSLLKKAIGYLELAP